MNVRRGGTQAVGNKMILPASGKEGRVCILGSQLLLQRRCGDMCTPFPGAVWAVVVARQDRAGLGCLAGRFCGQAGQKSKEWTNRPTSVESVPRLLLSCPAKGATGTE